MVQRPTDKPGAILTGFASPVRQGLFLPESTLSVGSLTVSAASFFLTVLKLMAFKSVTDNSNCNRRFCITAHIAYASTNKIKIVRIETELVFLPRADAPHVDAMLVLPQSY